MNIWLKNTESDKFKLPVTPESFTIAVSNGNTVVNVVSLGDINLLGKTGLMSCTLDSFFPAQDYNFSKNADRKDPYDYVDIINDWRESGTLIRLVITGTGISVLCSIESFSFGEKDGSGDVYYSLSLKEYKNVAVTKRKTKSVKASTYTTKKKDTLQKIAKKFYGDGGSKYRNKIYNANKSAIKSKTKVIKVGTKIKIPAMKITYYA